MPNTQNNPLQIDQVPTLGGGMIGMCACPGRTLAMTDSAEHWQRDLDDDLVSIVRWNADYLITLVETFEFDILGVPNLDFRIREFGIQWLHLPTENLCPPDFASLNQPPALDVFLDSELRKGKRIVMHCAAGKGRTGTLASALLIKQGWTANAAVAEVRKARPGTIESAAQLEFLLDYENANTNLRSNDADQVTYSSEQK